MPPRHVRPLTAERLEHLTAARLDAYRRRLLELEERAERSDVDSDQLQRLDPRLVYFKEDPRWAALHAAVLAARASRGE